MFASLYFKNFRCFQDTYISFRNKKGSVKPLITFFGNNASGKTALLKSLSFLKQSCDSLHYNTLLTTRKNPRFHHHYQHYSLEKETALHHRSYAKDETMHLIYEIVIGRQSFIYELIFSPYHELIQESLIRKTQQEYKIVFSANHDELRFEANTFSKKHMQTADALYERYFGDYTLLAVLNYAKKRNLIKISKNLQHFIEFVTLQHIHHDSYNHHDDHNYRKDISILPSSGITTNSGRLFLIASSPVLNEIVTSLFPAIDYVKYHYKKHAANLYHYELKTFLKTHSGSIEAPLAELPKSYLKVLSISAGMLDCYMGRTLILDDFSDNFHGYVMHRLIALLIQRCKGQIILTLTSTDLMNSIEPESVYICQNELTQAHVLCIEDIAKTRPNHNVRKRYESGVYGNLPSVPEGQYHKYTEYYDQVIETFQANRSDDDISK